MNTVRRGTFAALLLATTMAAQKTHQIGSVGATLRLDDSWRRQTLDKDDDADQFNGSKGGLLGRRELYATVRELQGLYENEADDTRALDMLTVISDGEPVVVRREAGWTRASRVIETKLGGIELVFHSQLLVQPGLAYHVLSWSPRSDRKFLRSRTEELLEGFAFPPEDATWRTACAPMRHTARNGVLQIELQAAPAFLTKVPNEYDEQLRLVSPDDEHIVMVYDTIDGATPEYLLGQELEALVEYESDTRELSRKPFALDGADATLMICQSKQSTTHTLLMQRNGSGMVLRYFAPGKASDPRPVRDALLASVRVAQLPAPLSLPDVPPDPAAGRFWPERSAKFFARSANLADLGTWSLSWSVSLTRDRLLACDSR
ncbi:MAG: hypothetical protein KAI24_22550, partial [Planctomycetes bacterium]|nr:hypothetical protein [Planctomycetota bacterium]